MHIHMKRKVILHGPATLTISLPSKWAKQNNIKKGDELDVQETGASIQIAANPVNYQNAYEIDVSKLSINLLNRILSCLHKNGYDTLHITCRPAQIKAIQKRLNMLMGYEIVEATERGCVIKTIAAPTDDEFDRLFKRVFLVNNTLANTILDLVHKKRFGDLAELQALEETNNRLTNYLHRLINQNVVLGRRETYLYLISWIQESIADDYRDLSLHLAKQKKISAETLQTLGVVNKLVEEFSQLFYSFEFSAVEKLIANQRSIEEKILHMVADKSNNDTSSLFILLSITRHIEGSIGSTIAYHN